MADRPTMPLEPDAEDGIYESLELKMAHLMVRDAMHTPVISQKRDGACARLVQIDSIIARSGMK